VVRDRLEAVVAPERVLGPAFYGYVDPTTFDPVDDEARVLETDDESAFETLRAAVPDEEWANGGPEFRPGETVGRFVDDLVAVAGYDVWDGLIAHVAVVTHPDHRSSGNGRAAVSLLTDRALDAGLLPQYRTSDAWPWSVALAEGLGYERFATSYRGVCDR
jgi:GNAT superfamily N-acetyltransferase